jgi:hypothetical protein
MAQTPLHRPLDTCGDKQQHGEQQPWKRAILVGCIYIWLALWLKKHEHLACACTRLGS